MRLFEKMSPSLNFRNCSPMSSPTMGGSCSAIRRRFNALDCFVALHLVVRDQEVEGSNYWPFDTPVDVSGICRRDEDGSELADATRGSILTYFDGSYDSVNRIRGLNSVAVCGTDRDIRCSCPNVQTSQLRPVSGRSQLKRKKSCGPERPGQAGRGQGSSEERLTTADISSCLGRKAR
jgi:hypothetical protein